MTNSKKCNYNWKIEFEWRKTPARIRINRELNGCSIDFIRCRQISRQLRLTSPQQLPPWFPICEIASKLSKGRPLQSSTIFKLCSIESASRSSRKSNKTIGCLRPKPPNLTDSSLPSLTWSLRRFKRRHQSMGNSASLFKTVRGAFRKT